MAENQKKARFHKVGAVLKKKDKPGVVIVLGNPNAKDEKYRTTAELILKDSKGNVIAKSSNFISVFDPRKRPGITEEQAEKISQRLVSELFLVEDAE